MGVALSPLQTTCGQRDTDGPVMTTRSVAISSLFNKLQRRPRVGIVSISLVRAQHEPGQPPRPTKPVTVEISQSIC
jgi:hypothetical protein